ncbi:MAG: hypothetical protein JXM69_13825 [Anaerolineae bacterium]|nr:hypothetical protein [Anaerolineae bacterium]
MFDQETSTALSERELQVLQLVATGASNQQIARKLVISVNTVKVHLRNIFEKLGVQSRTEATTRAIQEGWVVVEEYGANSAPSALKTFLIANRQAALQQWQLVYFALALLLALATMILPLRFKNAPIVKPYLPVIQVDENKFYEQQPTPTPIAATGNPSNRWSFQSPMPTHRAGLGVVALNGQIYAIGGVRTNDRATRLLEIYNPQTDTWSEGAAKPTATTNVSAAVIDDQIYVPGGCTNEGQAVDALEIYHSQTDTWTQGQPLPKARCGYGLAALADKLYLFGGWDGESFENTGWVYSVSDDAWEVLAAAMPEAKGFFGTASLDGKIYVVGGYDGQNEFAQTYIFDPDKGEWSEKTPLNEKRGGLGLVNAGKQLYAIGGGWDRIISTSEKYDPATDTWTTFEAPFTDQWRNAGLAVIDTKIYAIGGWNSTEGKYMDSVVSYQVLFQLFLPISVGN